MIPFTKSAAVVLLSTTAAFAGSLTEPAVAPAVEAPAPAASAWEGAYAGFAAGRLHQEWGDTGTETPFAIQDYANYGGFAGYNFVMSSGLAVGAEIAASMGSFPYCRGACTGTLTFFDAKARIGFAAGPALIYGFGGFSMAHEDDEGIPFSHSGWNAGAGIDVLVTDRMFVGAEYTYRSMTEASAPMWTTTGTLSARVGFKF